MWQSQSFNFYELDGQVDALTESGPFAIAIWAEPRSCPAPRGRSLTRCQRRTDRRNRASRAPVFDRVLAEHRDADVQA